MATAALQRAAGSSGPRGAGACPGTCSLLISRVETGHSCHFGHLNSSGYNTQAALARLGTGKMPASAIVNDFCEEANFLAGGRPCLLCFAGK